MPSTHSPGAGEVVLRLDGITKRFGPLVANDAISLDLRRGEVLALLGENGAGKSTLVSILFGHYVADGGTIEAFGRPLPPGDTRAAIEAGIGMVHQHFTLADNLGVLDNLMLGTEPWWQPWSGRREARARVVDASARYGLAVDPDARVGDLSVGERQRVEILKALVPIGRRRGARLLILDEPTAVLTPQESESLFATLAQLVAGGLAIVFISHRLDEVLRVSDRIAVLRAGRLVATLPAAGATASQLAEAMVGRSVAPASRRAALSDATSDPTPGALRGTVGATTPVCRLARVSTAGAPGLQAVDLELRRGEIVAIAGVAGNGQQALADLLCGLILARQGRVEVGGRVLAARPRDWIDAGVARIPEDRQAVGVIGDLPLWENAVIERHADPAYARAGLVRRGAARARARAIVERYDVRGTDALGVDTPTRALSGGNMQKLILGRVLMPTARPATARTAPPPLVVANQPTWGLDVGAVAYVHQQLLDAAAGGAAVLLISEDLDEIHALADRIAVIHEGRLTAARPTPDWTLTALGLAMAGAAVDAGATVGAGDVAA